MNLWEGTPPGAVDPARAGEPRAAEVPVLQVFLRDAAVPRPLVVVLPGGGYGTRAPHEAEPVARWLNGIGLHAAVCHYRVAPWRHPVPLGDAQRAVRLARTNAAAWGVDPDRIGILGFSAGGHLACSVANFGDDGDPCAADPVARASSRVQALVACYAVVTFGEKGHRGSCVNLLGDPPDPALKARLSLETTVTPRNPPAFLWHTAEDAGVPPENSLLYARALAAAGVPFALHVYPKGRHGLGLAADAPGSVRRWPDDCAAWLAELGWR
jgi:acetyl esterase/lipase